MKNSGLKIIEKNINNTKMAKRIWKFVVELFVVVVFSNKISCENQQSPEKVVAFYEKLDQNSSGIENCQTAINATENGTVVSSKTECLIVCSRRGHRNAYFDNGTCFCSDESCKQPTNDGQEIYRQLSEDNDDKENGQEVVTTTTATITTTTTTKGTHALNFHTSKFFTC